MLSKVEYLETYASDASFCQTRQRENVPLIEDYLSWFGHYIHLSVMDMPDVDDLFTVENILESFFPSGFAVYYFFIFNERL
jgi:hypothetical protein